MIRGFSLLLLILASVSSLSAEIVRIDVDGVIEPIRADFIREAVREAGEQGSSLLLIRLATPGGLGISMQEIIQEILNSRTPVVCFVAPSGSHAASAGFFILLSADVAAMAPGTNTGAAHPVFPFGSQDETLLEKIRNDALASLRSFVGQRGRNYEMAELAVVESRSYTAEEALEGGLIDLIAQDEDELLEQLNGRTITRLNGASEVLDLSNQPVRTIEMSFRQEVLSVIANPNIALMLGLIGLIALYIEVTSPGVVAPGVIGAICLLLALMGFSLVPLNFIGVLLILLALGLIAAEVFVHGFGVLGIGGAIALFFGLLMLVDTPYPELRIGWEVALVVALPLAFLFGLLLYSVVRNFRARVETGREGLVDQIGTAKTDIDLNGGKVFVGGEWWNAESKIKIEKGDRVRVLQVRNLTLLVEPLPKESLDQWR